MKSRSASVLFALVALVGFARQGFALPVPWRNCGSATDIISVSKLAASIWPPMGTPAPIQAMPIYDPRTGNLSSLTIDLLLGSQWVFETGNLAAPLVGGFVALPSSIPLALVSPTLPIPAGPTNITQTFTSPNAGSQPITIQSTANISQSITSVNATLSLSSDGNSGFAVPVSAGTSEAIVRANESDGQEIFCFDITLSALSFVEAPATSTSLSSSLDPSAAGEPVTFTAAVTSSAGTPAGDVSFNDGATLLGTTPVDASGHAVLSSSLAAGTHDLTATFNGSGGFAGSTSASSVLVQTVVIPTPALDERALLLLAFALAAIGALVLRRS